MIRIQKTNALIGISTTPARIRITQPKADFEINQKQPKVNIKTEMGKIKIDQTQCFNEVGLKNNTALTEDMAENSRQAAAEGTARIVSEGNSMAAIENRVNAVAEIAAANSIQTADWNIDFIPKSRPKIDFVGGNVDITVDEGYVEVKSKPNPPIIEVEAGKVEVFLRQKPEIKFEYVGNNLDKSI